MNKVFVDEGMETQLVREALGFIRARTKDRQGSTLTQWKASIFDQISTDPDVAEAYMRRTLSLLPPALELAWRIAHKLTGRDEETPDGIQLNFFSILGMPVKVVLAYASPGVPGGHESMTAAEAPIVALLGQAEVTLRKARDSQIVGTAQFEQAQEALRRSGGNANALLIDVADK